VLEQLQIEISLTPVEETVVVIRKIPLHFVSTFNSLWDVFLLIIEKFFKQIFSEAPQREIVEVDISGLLGNVHVRSVSAFDFEDFVLFFQNVYIDENSTIPIFSKLFEENQIVVEAKKVGSIAGVGVGPAPASSRVGAVIAASSSPINSDSFSNKTWLDYFEEESASGDHVRRAKIKDRMLKVIQSGDKLKVIRENTDQYASLNQLLTEISDEQYIEPLRIPTRLTVAGFVGGETTKKRSSAAAQYQPNFDQVPEMRMAASPVEIKKGPLNLGEMPKILGRLMVQIMFMPLGSTVESTKIAYLKSPLPNLWGLIGNQILGLLKTLSELFKTAFRHKKRPKDGVEVNRKLKQVKHPINC